MPIGERDGTRSRDLLRDRQRFWFSSQDLDWNPGVNPRVSQFDHAHFAGMCGSSASFLFTIVTRLVECGARVSDTPITDRETAVLEKDSPVDLALVERGSPAPDRPA